MPTAIWIAFGGAAVAVVVLCSPPVVRLLSRSTTAPEPPEHSAGLHLGTVTIPLIALDAGSLDVAATGRLVRVKALPSGNWVFTLRHRWISNDLGLPAGFVLEGSISSSPDGAQVSVFTPLAAAVSVGLVWTLLMIGSASSLVMTPSLDAAAFMALVTWVGYEAWRRGRRAVRLVAADAVAALQADGRWTQARERASGSADPGGSTR